MRERANQCRALTAGLDCVIAKLRSRAHIISAESRRRRANSASVSRSSFAQSQGERATQSARLNCAAAASTAQSDCESVDTRDKKQATCSFVVANSTERRPSAASFNLRPVARFAPDARAPLKSWLMWSAHQVDELPPHLLRKAPAGERARISLSSHRRQVAAVFGIHFDCCSSSSRVRRASARSRVSVTLRRTSPTATTFRLLVLQLQLQLQLQIRIRIRIRIRRDDANAGEVLRWRPIVGAELVYSANVALVSFVSLSLDLLELNNFFCFVSQPTGELRGFALAKNNCQPPENSARRRQPSESPPGFRGERARSSFALQVES